MEMIFSQKETSLLATSYCETRYY